MSVSGFMTCRTDEIFKCCGRLVHLSHISAVDAHHFDYCNPTPASSPYPKAAKTFTSDAAAANENTNGTGGSNTPTALGCAGEK
jgi:hypothetical protein